MLYRLCVCRVFSLENNRVMVLTKVLNNKKKLMKNKGKLGYAKHNKKLYMY